MKNFFLLTFSVLMILSGKTYSADVYSYADASTVESAGNAPCSSLQGTGSVTAVTCKGAANGAITLSVSGGNPPYSYQWNDGSTVGSRINLSSGTYTVTVTDDSSCVKTIIRWVPQPLLLKATGSVTAATCRFSEDGAIDISVSGGTAPYIYLWNDGSTDQNRTNLGRGNYTVSVTGSGSVACTGSLTVWVGSPSVLTGSVTVTSATCFNTSDGSIAVTYSGGSPPYSYLWSNGATTASNMGIERGTHTLTVVDANGCSDTIVRWVNSPNELLISHQIIEPSTTVASDGSVKSWVFGGTPPYTWSWSDGQSTQNATGLPIGDITLIVTDAVGCIDSITVILTGPISIGNPVSDVGISLYPNPGNDIFTIEFSGNSLSNISMELVDVRGRLMQVSFEEAAPGRFEFGANLRPGIYFLRIQGKDFTRSLRVVRT